jgi:hypothetical protein
MIFPAPHYRDLAALGKRVGAEGGAEASHRLETDLRNIEAAVQLRDFIRFSGLATDHLL